MTQNAAQVNYWSQPDLLVKDEPAVVVMSGGQDSTTCLGVALSRHSKVVAVSFDYGQKHIMELDAATAICEKRGVDHRVIAVPVLRMMESSALVTHGDTTKEHEYLKGLPASFVPVRNALFLTMAFGIAMELGAKHIYTGVCETDYSGYPDCRDDFVKALQSALSVGYKTEIAIHTPLMFLDKADTFELARRLGVMDEVMGMSLTCYNNVTEQNEWGKGCGECPACKLRKNGFAEYKNRYNQEG